MPVVRQNAQMGAMLPLSSLKTARRGNIKRITIGHIYLEASFKFFYGSKGNVGILKICETKLDSTFLRNNLL